MRHCACDAHEFRQVSQFIESQLEDLNDELKERLLPVGADRALPQAPPTELTEADIDAGTELFDEVQPDLAGMLRATPTDAPADTLYTDTDTDTDWEWDAAAYTYTQTGTGVSVDETEKDDISIDVMDIAIAYLLAETAELLLREMSVQDYVTTMYVAIEMNLTLQYTLGVGGKHVLTPARVEGLKGFIQRQKAYFGKFAEEIKAGELTGAKILQRVGMYGEAVTEGYEQAKAASHRIRLPEYPADGNQNCLVNCRCRWVLEDDGDFVDAHWRLNPTAEHCDTCVGNSRKWNPLRVKKGE